MNGVVGCCYAGSEALGIIRWGKKAGRTLNKIGPPKRRERARRIGTIKFLTLDETKRLFSRIKDKRDRAIFLTAYRHGLRASEVGLLRTDDLDLKRLKIMLHRIKGLLSGEHPLQPDEAHPLKVWLKSKRTDSPILFPSRRNLPISRQMLDVLVKRYGAEANIPKEKRHFHVLKHSIATHLSVGYRCRPSLLTGLARPCQHPEHSHLRLARLTQPRAEGARILYRANTL